MHPSQENVSLSDPDTELSTEKKSVEDLLSGSGKEDTLSTAAPATTAANTNTAQESTLPLYTTSTTTTTQTTTVTTNGTSSRQPSPQLNRRCASPQPSPKKHSPQPSTSSSSGGSGRPNGNNGRREQSRSDTLLLVPCNFAKCDNSEDSLSKSSDSSSKLALSDRHNKSSSSGSGSQQELERPKSVSKVTERARKKAWYSVLYPSYKSRSEDFKKLFKDVPDDERLIVDYSCAIQRDILVHGRLYVSQNYLCFYANIFRWETCLSLKWKDVTSVTKEKTALVIPNAILVCTQNEKHFLTSFATRDKAYLMLFRVWQNALMGKQMQPQEMWQWVHNCYGDELGLTSDDEDYIDPYEGKEEKIDILHNIPKSELCTKLADSILDDNVTSDLHSDDILTSDGQFDDDDKSSTLKPQKPNQECQNMMRARSTRTARLVMRDNSQCDQLPTDMSDSSDSEENKISFTNQAECTSMHEGRQLVHTILPITVDNLFSLLFTKSKFLLDLHNARRTTNMVQGEWTVNEEGIKERTSTMTVAVTQPIGPKSSNVTEVAQMRSESKPGELYSIDQTATNAGIPYADSFYVTQHYCLQRTVDDHTVMSVHAQIKYKKSVWGVVKGFIEKNTWAGLEEFYTALVRALQSEYCIPPAKSKARIKRRTANQQQRPPDEPRASIKSIPSTIAADFKNKLLHKEPIIEARAGRYERLSWFVIILLFGLIIVNVVLYLKLWSLEQKTIERDKFPNFSTIKDPPKSHEEWLRILQQQESLHATEMMKWQRVLQTAIELLRKTERALTDLQFLIKLQRSGPLPTSEPPLADGDYRLEL